MNGIIIKLSCLLSILLLGWVILRVIVRKEYLKRGRLSVPVSILQALLFFTYGGSSYVYISRDWPDVQVPIVIHIAGMVLLIGGLIMLFYCMTVLSLLSSIGLGKNFVSKGVYRISRNPQAISCGLSVIGFAILWPSWYALFWGILYFVLIHLMIVTEEEHLLRTYGSKYIKYIEEVPRYF